MAALESGRPHGLGSEDGSDNQSRNHWIGKGGSNSAGASGLEPEQAARYLCGFLGSETPANPRPDLNTPWMAKFASEDVKAYYLEAASAQPGGKDAGSRQLNDWFWHETAAGLIFLQLSQVLAKSNDGWTQIIGQVLMVPTAHGQGPAGKTKPAKP